MRCCLCDIRVGSIDIHVVISVRGGLTENNYMDMRAWCCCKSSFVNVFFVLICTAIKFNRIVFYFIPIPYHCLQ